MHITPAKLRAQRANARRSTGPRTPEGRRRSALNSLKANHSGVLPRSGPGFGKPEDFHCIWRDLLALFWFVKPISAQNRNLLLSRLESLAWAWWTKLSLAETPYLERQNAQIADLLGAFLEELGNCGQQHDYWLRKKFGTDSRHSLAALRESIEAHLAPFRAARASGGPKEVSSP